MRFPSSRFWKKYRKGEKLLKNSIGYQKSRILFWVQTVEIILQLLADLNSTQHFQRFFIPLLNFFKQIFSPFLAQNFVAKGAQHVFEFNFATSKGSALSSRWNRCTLAGIHFLPSPLHFSKSVEITAPQYMMPNVQGECKSRNKPFGACSNIYWHESKH